MFGNILLKHSFVGINNNNKVCFPTHETCVFSTHEINIKLQINSYNQSTSPYKIFSP